MNPYLQCMKCQATYKTHQQLMRHVRNSHPSKIIRCNMCSYMVSSSLRYRMVNYQRLKHCLTQPDKKTTCLTIPNSPYVQKQATNLNKTTANATRKRNKSIFACQQCFQQEFVRHFIASKYNTGVWRSRPSKPCPKGLISSLWAPVKVVSPLSDETRVNNWFYWWVFNHYRGHIHESTWCTYNWNSLPIWVETFIE